MKTHGHITITERELIQAEPTYATLEPSVIGDGSMPLMPGELPIEVKVFDALQNLLFDQGLPLNPLTKKPLKHLNYERIEHGDGSGKITFKWSPK